MISLPTTLTMAIGSDAPLRLAFFVLFAFFWVNVRVTAARDATFFFVLAAMVIP
jgi:hypothetical protein